MLAAAARELKGHDDGIAGHDARPLARIRDDADRLMTDRERTREHAAPRAAADRNVQIEVASPDRQRPHERVGLRRHARAGHLVKLQLARLDERELAHGHGRR
jgi:hypothetical protein